MQPHCHLEILIKKDMENHAHFKVLTGSENISSLIFIQNKNKTWCQ